MNTDTSLDEHKDPQNNNNALVKLIKKCTTFLSAGDEIQLRQKIIDLNGLYAMWNSDTDEDYPAGVYAAVAEMFASNVFRPLPPSSYMAADDDECGVDGGGGLGGAAEDHSAADAAALEFQQTAMAYQTFRSFVDRLAFDGDMAGPHMGRRFAGGLAHRLNAADMNERLTARDTMIRVRETCPQAQAGVLDAAVDELADFAYGYAPRHNGVHELLDFVADTVVYTDVSRPAVEKLSRVLLRLLKHQYLYSFKTKLIECIRALDSQHDGLIPKVLVFIMDIWKSHNVKTIVLLRTMVELYEWCNKENWIKLQLPVVCHISKFFSDYDFQLAEESMNFWIRIMHENIKYWQGRKDDVRVVVNALKKVKRTHWNSDCVSMAKNLLKIMVMKNVIKDSCVEDPEDMFQEGKSKVINYYDYISQKILKPLVNHSKSTV
ncbi:serine/threonine-protein phosphatase 2A 56 kDa regulatory subunit gamma isoform-like [Metopolophium dirhodum]|uniref:serine/threonine-protein phosphatase 2A 56 kDa regulatory subunit gamma isoform-like n=1 Tax=Metopolophium dirhodum TaxID=44670 RepID=UPI00298F4EB6|nr:serine/threonine-protein phosphatase 2A 56 kDa regulatory subunit gamma isoform-like [Metopolophium dirhodum]